MIRAVTLIALTALACGCDPDGGDSDIPIPSGSADDCGSNAPWFHSVTIVDGGMQTYDQGVYPSILVRADTEDDDGDLHYYEMRVWWDDVVDGSVNTTTSYQDIYGTVSDSPCELQRTTFSMQLAVTGSTPPFDTDLEFGVVVYDDAENPSKGGEPEIVVFHTPDAEGNYP